MSDGQEDSNGLSNQEDDLEKSIIAGRIPRELDLASLSGDHVSSVRIRPMQDVEQIREGVRSNIAILLVVLLYLITFFSFCIFVYDSSSRSDLKDLLTLFIAPIVGILGTVLGFYFGAEVGKNK